ncbi:Spo11/DNA topoisomerase VI subunit A [Gautieria morchelliformis]|nr:Spo11/DNA topoisomerase VI subunit A [Gautieria morchelliformis]
MNIPMTKRDIFYKDVHLFKAQSVVDDLVDDLAATLDVSRGDLNIRASPKGLFCGSGLSIHMKRGSIVHGADSEGTLIPAGVDISHVEVSETVSWVLIVEKEAVFQTLCRANLASHSSCPGPGLVITGKGYPDLATRELVGHLSVTLPTSIPLLALVDADAFGLDILSVYKFGSQSLAHERNRTTAPRIIWLGLWASELSSLSIDRDDLIPLTEHDHKKALLMLKRDNTMMPTQWKKEISYMLHTRRKAEIEIISSTPSKIALHPDAPHHPAVQIYFAGDPPKYPLVEYLIPKLKLFCAHGQKMKRVDEISKSHHN